MKILHIIDSGGLYGAEMVVLNLVAEQIRQGLEPIIASIGEKGVKEKPLEAEAIRRGFRVEKFRMRPGPNYIGALNVLGFAHREGVNILHSHGYKGNILFGLIPKRIRKIPMVSTMHGWTSTSNSFSKMRLYEWLDRKSLKHIDSVILVSNAMKSDFRLRNFDPIKVRVIHNGIPIPENQLNDLTNQPFNHSPIQSTQSTQQTLDQSIIDFCSKGFTIGSIGRLSKEKGYRYLIESLAILIKRTINARLIIIGEGSERNYLEGLVVQFELADRVLIPGYRENAKQYIPFFSVFVISSLTEGLPITLLEAAKAMAPIVATEVGGISDVLKSGEAGLLIEPCNAKAIVQAIELLYYNEKLSDKLTAAAYNRVTKLYSSKKMAMEYSNVYNVLI
jgi:glycosyltransferase involved in cell wall biosynthesis